MSLQYFELPKLPKAVNSGDELILWLSLFRARTEEELAQIEKMEVPVMKEAIGAYRHVSATKEFQELERIRFEASCNEASALNHARREGKKEGTQEKAIAIAKKMKDSGAEISYIIEMTDLTVDDILRL
jgi:predicted transposase/invertase (TIGR01784 family)